MVIREILNKVLHIYKRLIELTVEMTYDYHIVRQDFIITFVLYLWLFLSLRSSTQRNNLGFLLFKKLVWIFNRILAEVSISYPVKN